MSQLDESVLIIFNELRLKAGSPTYTTMATRAGCSKSTVFTALQGNMIQWPSMERIAKALNADDETVIKLRNMWIKTKMQQKPTNTAPLWVMDVQRKLDEINTKLDTIIKRLGL